MDGELAIEQSRSVDSSEWNGNVLSEYQVHRSASFEPSTLGEWESFFRNLSFCLFRLRLDAGILIRSRRLD